MIFTFNFHTLVQLGIFGLQTLDRKYFILKTNFLGILWCFLHWKCCRLSQVLIFKIKKTEAQNDSFFFFFFQAYIFSEVTCSTRDKWKYKPSSIMKIIADWVINSCISFCNYCMVFAVTCFYITKRTEVCGYSKTLQFLYKYAGLY